MTDEHNDFFVTGKVIDYLNYKSYLEHKDTCSSSIESKMAIEAGHEAGKREGKDELLAGIHSVDRHGHQIHADSGL